MNVTDPSSAARAPLGEGGQVRLLHKALPPLLQVLGGDEPDGVALRVPGLPPAGVGGVDDLEDITVLERKTNFCARQESVLYWIITEQAAHVILKNKSNII